MQWEIRKKTNLQRLTWMESCLEKGATRGSRTWFELLICVYTASCWSRTLCAALPISSLVPDEFKVLHLQPSSAVSLEVVLYWILLSLKYVSLLLHDYWINICDFFSQKPVTHLQCLVPARFTAWSCSIDRKWDIVFQDSLFLSINSK